MTIEEAREIIELADKMIGDDFDPFEALTNPNYFPAGYEEANKVIAEWENSHSVNQKTGKIFKKKHCRKCGGLGFIFDYHHIDHGKCWNCNGIGYIEIYE